MKRRLLIMAGGTGGHLFPALAVADLLSRRGVDIHWMGSQGGMERELIPRRGYPIDLIAVSGLRGKGLLGWLVAPVRLLRALTQSILLIRRLRPDAVLGMGGFVAGPGGVAARLLGRPLLIHEQNAIPGMTNRLLAAIATRVMQAFPLAFANRAGVITTGNPVGSEMSAAARVATVGAPLHLLVLGGSLGAAALNRVVPAALALLQAEYRPEVVHQCGERHLDSTREGYRDAGVEAQVIPFIDHMAETYRWADLVICRAGAMTVSELAVTATPAILVPYPYAVDDHQSANAAYLVNAGAAELLQEGALDAGVLAERLNEFCSDGDRGIERLAAMGAQARTLAHPDAARVVADLCEEIIGGGR